MARTDPHSWFDDSGPRTSALDLKLRVDFAARRIEGKVTLELHEPAEGAFDLDARALEIRRCRNDRGDDVVFEIAEEDPILGQRLRLTLPAGTRSVTVDYGTSPEASALQWLEPGQTSGKRHPFLFSQCQSIHARSMVPCQDTPIVRVPYTAEVTVPEGLTAVMSAGPEGERAGDAPRTTTFAFRMPQPIPSYLIAIAVGELAHRDLSPRSRVWAEPATVEAAAWEFAEIEQQIGVAEGLFGPYDWDRFDMIVLPPSFPFGGMENPRLTFLTPTLLAGDRSLVDVVVHELAHSWTGNLVTNATMDHFWLNEGFTVWSERRILEALHGADAAALSWAIGQSGLDRAIARFGADSPSTKLRMELEGVDPDAVYSQIAYEKGARFVVALERSAGRERFDRFLREYMRRFRFASLTTESFVDFLREALPDVAEAVPVQTWLYEPGMPDDAPTFHSDRLEALQTMARGWAEGVRPSDEQVASWSASEFLIYLQGLPHELGPDDCAWLDEHLGLTGRGNYEILVEWLTIAAGSDYEPALPKVREVLTSVGRMKYLRPLYGALARSEGTRRLARETYAVAKDGYHGLSRRSVESVLEAYPAD